MKLGNNPEGTAHCIKYHFDDLLKFTLYLDINGANGNGSIYIQTEAITKDYKLEIIQSMIN